MAVRQESQGNAQQALHGRRKTEEMRYSEKALMKEWSGQLRLILYSGLSKLEVTDISAVSQTGGGGKLCCGRRNGAGGSLTDCLPGMLEAQFDSQQQTTYIQQENGNECRLLLKKIQLSQEREIRNKKRKGQLGAQFLRLTRVCSLMGNLTGKK